MNNEKPKWGELYNWSHKHLFIDLSLLYDCEAGIYDVGTYTDGKIIHLLFNWLYDKNENFDGIINTIDKYVIKIPYGEWWSEWKYNSQAYVAEYDAWCKNKMTDPVHQRIIEGTKEIDITKRVW